LLEVALAGRHPGMAGTVPAPARRTRDWASAAHDGLGTRGRRDPVPRHRAGSARHLRGREPSGQFSATVTVSCQR